MTDAPAIHATRINAPPAWALAQRHLIGQMEQAALRYQERYTRADGTFIWRDEWPGMDGSDDGYESYHNWPLLYLLAGSSELHRRSRVLWDAITRQFSAYGQVYREFDAYYDWMHHGESSLFLYYLGMADPHVAVDRARALRFAHMYTGDDPLAPNWDATHRLIRSPINGSRGPRFENSWDDWSTHRAVLANYPPPFDDIPGVTGPTANWNDDTIYREILARLNKRQMHGDVPLNLTATSLVTHAFCYTGDERYRRWVLDYLEAWAERIAANGGLCPDNIGPTGQIGECMDGKWWGGYYGWQWPHGLMTIIQPLTVAAMNAVLLTGDMRYLDLPRGQLDQMIERGRVENGHLLVPHRHTDQGWTAYQPLSPEYPLQLWYLSQARQDLERLERFPERQSDWLRVEPGRGKGDTIHIAPWHMYLQGQLPDYPRQILEAQWNEVARRMELIRTDDADPEQIDVHHWQDRNPVHTEALLQLTCGGPQVIYHGGLLHTRLRHFDADTRQPGLPPDVAALVRQLDADSITIELTNTSAMHARRLLMQAGAFGEHQIIQAQDLSSNPAAVPVNQNRLAVTLPASSSITLRLTMQRFVHRPSYKR